MKEMSIYSNIVGLAVDGIQYNVMIFIAKNKYVLKRISKFVIENGGIVKETTKMREGYRVVLFLPYETKEGRLTLRICREKLMDWIVWYTETRRDKSYRSPMFNHNNEPEL